MSAAPAISSTTAFPAAVARHASTLKDLFRRAFSRTTVPQSDYIRRLKKSVLSSIRCRAVEIVTALVIDLAHRGSLEEAEAIGLHLAAIARAEHPGSDPELTLAEAKIAEATLEGDCNAAEDRMLLDPTLTNRLAYLAAAAKHAEARRVLDRAVRAAIARGERV